MSNTVIQIKKSDASGNIPNANTLSYGELAINYNDGIIYYKNNVNQIKTIRLQDVFESVNVNGTLLVPTSVSDILSFKSESGITLTGHSSNDTIIIGETLSPIINVSLSQSNAAFEKANAAYDSAQTGIILAQSGYNQANTGTILAQAGFDKANASIINISDYYPTANDYGHLYDVTMDQAFGDELKQISFDLSNEPVIPRGYFLTKDFGHLV